MNNPLLSTPKDLITSTVLTVQRKKMEEDFSNIMFTSLNKKKQKDSDKEKEKKKAAKDEKKKKKENEK